MTIPFRFIVVAACLVPASLWAQPKSTRGISPEGIARIEREVRHELVMVPQYGVFDYLAYQVNGETVILTGSVRQPITKTNAENGVKRIEGVMKVENKIIVLPVFRSDDAIRLAIYNSIYGFPALQRYALQAIPSIHIIVSNGNVTLEGSVATKADADLALIRAKTVPGTFQVTSNLKPDNPPPATKGK